MPHEEPKQVSVDELAAITAREFQAVHEEIARLATKDDLAVLKEEMKENFGSLQKDIAGRLDLVLKTIRTNVDSRLSLAEEQIRELQEHR